jgi:hypothetical protein
MKTIVYTFLVLSLFIFSCGTQQNTVASTSDTEKEEPVRIANDSLEYEIMIIDIGFNNYLYSIAKPMSYYSNEYLQSRNVVYVSEWNSRARNPSRFNPNIYENIIDYQSHIDYGLEVNYKLFWYFQFAQRKYNMRLGSFRVIGS